MKKSTLRKLVIIVAYLSAISPLYAEEFNSSFETITVSGECTEGTTVSITSKITKENKLIFCNGGQYSSPIRIPKGTLSEQNITVTQKTLPVNANEAKKSMPENLNSSLEVSTGILKKEREVVPEKESTENQNVSEKSTKKEIVERMTSEELRSYVFKRKLHMGSIGEDVKVLQTILNNTGYLVDTYGSGSYGFETERFGRGTYDALERFKRENGIVTNQRGVLTRLVITELKNLLED